MGLFNLAAALKSRAMYTVRWWRGGLLHLKSCSNPPAKECIDKCECRRFFILDIVVIVCKNSYDRCFEKIKNSSVKYVIYACKI